MQKSELLKYRLQRLMNSSDAAAFQLQIRTRKTFADCLWDPFYHLRKLHLWHSVHSEVTTRDSRPSTHRSETMHTNCLALSTRFAKITPTPWSWGVFCACPQENWQDQMKKKYWTVWRCLSWPLEVCDHLTRADDYRARCGVGKNTRSPACAKLHLCFLTQTSVTRPLYLTLSAYHAVAVPRYFRIRKLTSHTWFTSI